MRRALPILLLALAACGSKDGSSSNDSAPGPAGDPLANLAAPLSDESALRLEALISRAIPTVLQNAKEAQYRNVRPGVGGSGCGEVAP